jgi:hypothetical protein
VSWRRFLMLVLLLILLEQESEPWLRALDSAAV